MKPFAYLIGLAVVGCGAGTQSAGEAATDAMPTPTGEAVSFDRSGSLTEDQAPSVDRQIIRRGELEVRVEDAAQAADEATSIANRLGGYVETSTESNLEGARPYVNLTVRVPVDRFDDALNGYEGLGTTLSASTSGEDVTDQLVDLEARLGVMRAEEAAYVGILSRAENVEEVLTVRQRISQVRQEIESIDARRQTLSELAALSTIRLTLTQSTLAVAQSDQGWLGETFGAATTSLANFGRALGAMLVWIGVYLPVWGVLAFVGWLVSRKLRNKPPRLI